MSGAWGRRGTGKRFWPDPRRRSQCPIWPRRQGQAERHATGDLGEGLIWREAYTPYAAADVAERLADCDLRPDRASVPAPRIHRLRLPASQRVISLTRNVRRSIASPSGTQGPTDSAYDVKARELGSQHTFIRLAVQSPRAATVPRRPRDVAQTYRRHPFALLRAGLVVPERRLEAGVTAIGALQTRVGGPKCLQGRQIPNFIGRFSYR